ncbi:MAG: alpha/beta fold hydrolase [Chitinophagaceae bacterium]|nr:alpha/beta fold hydrolase [Chitinophagaceae bacterium]
MKQLFGYASLILLTFFVSCKKEPIILEAPIVEAPSPIKGVNSAPDPNAIIETSLPIQQAITYNVNANIGGYQEALPARYNLTNKKYPLLIFIHGTGEQGNGSNDLWMAGNIGIAALIKNGKFPPSFQVSGVDHSFIVLSPQFRSWPSVAEVNNLIDFAISKYRVDVSRVYLSGLSMGGGATWEYAAQHSSKIAAIVPICGAAEPTNGKAEKIARANLPVWAFHNTDDRMVTVWNSIGFTTKINSYLNAVPAKFTQWASGGHDAWTKATDPNYKENGMNMYEWMLQYKR